MLLVDEQPRTQHRLHLPRRLFALLAVVAATLTGGALALVTFHQERSLSVGEIHLSVDPGHRGALDVYVPLVDWGVRFEAVRLPARLRVDLRTVDRAAVARVAGGGTLDVHDVRVEARDAIAAYLRALVAVVFTCALVVGLLVAFAIRGGPGPRLRVTTATAAGTALAGALAIALLLPPRGPIDRPQYYAHGPDLPRALQALEAVQRSGAAIDEELDSQLVGLARLVVAPGRRATLAGRPTVTVASDLHNNALVLSTLAQTAGDGPLLFVGDLTDRGSPVEASVTEGIVHSGHPFVFVTGNHDSDALARRLAREGAIVLTQRGRLRADGGFGATVVHVGGLRVAGYADPFERRRRDGFADRYDRAPTPAQQAAFSAWLHTILDRVDVVMVHEPALIDPVLRELRARPPEHPLVFLVGHTHRADLRRFGTVTVLNPGSVGAGGTGNLTEKTAIGIGRLVYDIRPSFVPRAADLISIDPGSGSATARRDRLDEPAR